MFANIYAFSNALRRLKAGSKDTAKDGTSWLILDSQQ